VIGGGLAGCWAAATAAASGARVTLVRRALGATATSAGPLDFVPPAEAADPAAWLARLPRTDPTHPYVASGAAPSIEELEAEAERLSLALAAAGLPVRASLRNPLLLGAITGQVRLAGVAPETQATGDLQRASGRSVAVVGVAGLARFDAKAVAAALDERRLGWPAPLRAAAVTVAPELALITPELAADLDDATLARAIEMPGGAEALGAAIAQAIRGADLALLPAVLGLDDPESVAARVAAAAGLPVAELVTSPPSAPGWRLQRACDRVVADAGVRLAASAARTVTTVDGHATAVTVANGDMLPCDAVVLATGKYLGGGIVADPRPREPLLDLPLFSRDTAVTRLALRDLVERARFRDQPFASLGVRTDGEGTPVDEHGRALYGNVTACGDLLAGLDPTLSGGGLGVVAWTATRAAHTALRQVGAAAA